MLNLRPTKCLLWLCAFFCLAFYGNGRALAQSTESVTTEKPKTLYFHVGKYDFDPEFKGNGETMHRIVQQIDSLNQNPSTEIRAIKVYTSTSPEGGKKLNVKLASDRSRSIVEYLVKKYPHLTAQIVISSELAPDWDMLYDLVKNTNGMTKACKSDVLGILDRYKDYYNSDYSLVDPREKALKKLNGGDAWRWMLKNLYPEIRYAKIELSHKFIDTSDEQLEEIRPFIIPVIDIEEIVIPEPVEEEPIVGEPVDTVVIEPEPVKDTKFLFALKTNMLYDVAGAFNGALEVPIAKHWSIQGEAVWPWWVSGKDKWCYQMGYINAEARYWLGSRHIGNPIDQTRQINPLTGHFFGLTGGWAYYDFGNNYKGHQGETIVAGITYGYAMRLNKCFNLEFELGLGWAHSKFRRYNVMEIQGDRYLVNKHDNGRYNWFGPISAKITLSWLLFKH